jgi:hypothetical protein
MKLKILAIILATCASVGAVEAPRPRAVAKICLNVVVTVNELEKAANVIQAQGCQESTFVPLGDGYYLAYGVQVLIGE